MEFCFDRNVGELSGNSVIFSGNFNNFCDLHL